MTVSRITYFFAYPNIVIQMKVAKSCKKKDQLEYCLHLDNIPCISTEYLDLRGNGE